MNTRVCLVALFLIIFNEVPCSSFNNCIESLNIHAHQNKVTTQTPYGKWRVVSYKMGNGEESLTAKEAKKFINKIIIVSRDSIVGLNHTCHWPEFKISRVNVEQYLIDYWKVTFNIGINQDSITVVTANGYDDKFPKGGAFTFYDDYLILNSDRMILPEPGPFFFCWRGCMKENKRENKNAKALA